MNKTAPEKTTLKIPIKQLRNFIIIVAVLVVTFAAGFTIGAKNESGGNGFPIVNINRNIPADKTLDFTLFWQVWDTLAESYFDTDQIVPAQLVYGAIKGMVSAVGDPYTVFLTPDENKVTQEDLQGNFEGVGIQIGFRGSQLAVIAPLPGTPAEEADIKAGDFIVGIRDDTKDIDRGTRGMSLPEAVKLIRGPAGSTVSLTLLREGEDVPVIADVVRQGINVPSIITSFIESEELGGGSIAHIRILKFGGQTQREWDEVVREVLKTDSVDGVIIDLRNNPGGFLQGAVDIGSEFMELGEVVVIEDRGDGDTQEFRVERMGRLKEEKLVVLVNEGSASASEILAGALRDNNKVVIVGNKTFGKGTIQEPQQLSGGVGLHITVAKWLTPSGVWVNEVGLEPDIAIEDDPETIEDEQLQEAINLLNDQTSIVYGQI